MAWIRTSGNNGGKLEVKTASGDIASFETNLAMPLKSVTVNIEATGGNGTPDSPNPINGYTEANITRCGVNLVSDTFENGLPNTTIGSSYNSITPTTRYSYLNLGKMNGTFTISIRDYDANYFDWVAIFCYNNDLLAEIKSVSTFSGQSFNLSSFDKCRILCGAVSGYNEPSAISTVGKLQLELGLTATEYTPYNGQTYDIAFGQTVYGGVVDVTRGKLTVTHANIASYNGESINEPWLSSMDTYVPNTTPTTGAQVVYPLTTPFDIDLTPEVISAVVGTNNVFADCGQTEVKYLKRE